MIAIDTNVLVRIVVQDSDQQAQAQQAQALIKKAGSAFIPQIVQVELVNTAKNNFILLTPLAL